MLEPLDDEATLFEKPQSEPYCKESALCQDIHGQSVIKHDLSYLLLTDDARNKQWPVMVAKLAYFPC